MYFIIKSFSMIVEVREEMKMKKIFLTLGFLIAFIISELGACAKTNQLHTITLKKNNGEYNIILDTDSISKVSRKIVSNNEMILELSGISSSGTVNALYKGSDSIDNLVIENTGFNKLKIYISAPNIKNSSVIMQPQTGDVALVGEPFPAQKTLWIIFVLAVLAIVIKYSIHETKDDNNILIKRDIKDREIQLYRQYRRSIDDGVSLQSKEAKMRNILKKIDRKIDERLSMTLK